jgi:hypothetical protein
MVSRKTTSVLCYRMHIVFALLFCSSETSDDCQQACSIITQQTELFKCMLSCMLDCVKTVGKNIQICGKFRAARQKILYVMKLGRFTLTWWI